MTSQSLFRMTEDERGLFNALVKAIKQHEPVVGTWQVFHAVAIVAAALLAVDVQVIDRARAADKLAKMTLEDVEVWQRAPASNPFMGGDRTMPAPLSNAQADRDRIELAQAILDICGRADEWGLDVASQMQAIMEAAASLIVVITNSDDAKVDRIVEDLIVKLRAIIRAMQASAGKLS